MQITTKTLLECIILFVYHIDNRKMETGRTEMFGTVLKLAKSVVRGMTDDPYFATYMLAWGVENELDRRKSFATKIALGVTFVLFKFCLITGRHGCNRIVG